MIRNSILLKILVLTPRHPQFSDGMLFNKGENGMLKKKKRGGRGEEGGQGMVNKKKKKKQIDCDLGISIE